MSNLFQRKLILKIFLMVFSHYSAGQNQPNTNEKPNVILIYVDDLGYGDISIAGGQIPTPAIDRLGHEGLQLQNAYSTAATCTPSRYSLLTGEYAWRAKGRGVAPGAASALIRKKRQTWHILGLQLSLGERRLKRVLRMKTNCFISPMIQKKR